MATGFDDRERTMRPELTGLLSRNIRAMLKAREELDRQKSVQERLADRITAFTGSMPFVYLHAVIYGLWIVINLGFIPAIKPWDRFPFVMLAVVTSVEAIFLATFVLISQNRMQKVADMRADLDLQVNLLAEHEVTRLLELVDAIAKRVGADLPPEPDLEALKEDVAPEQVLREIERAEGTPARGRSSH